MAVTHWAQERGGTCWRCQPEGRWEPNRGPALATRPRRVLPGSLSAPGGHSRCGVPAPPSWAGGAGAGGLDMAPPPPPASLDPAWRHRLPAPRFIDSMQLIDLLRASMGDVVLSPRLANPR